ncbi:class I histocompatibility antigen, F10 alpha chain-like isoform X2 [Mustelus asterias]
MLRILFSISLCFSCVSSDSNSITTVFVATSGITELPEYFGVSMINGVPVTSYDSDTHQTVSRQQWMADSFDGEYWEYLTNQGNKLSAMAKENLRTIMKGTNQTSGVHILQWIRNIEVSEDGSIKRSMSVGFDGKDYISLESERMRWVATHHNAVKTKEKWDSDESWNTFWKWLMEVELVERLKSRLYFGKKYLNRKVQPDVFISRSAPIGLYKLFTLSCLVTGFYPADIEVTWLRNGEVMSETLSSGVRPNHDETHQIQKVIEINAGDEDQYSCQIEHSSLAESKIHQWEIPESGGHSQLGIIAGSIISVLAAIFGIIAIAIWKRPQRGKKESESGESGSGESAQLFLETDPSHHHPETMDNNVELDLSESDPHLTLEPFPSGLKSSHDPVED